MSPCNKGASTLPPRPINQTLTGSTKTKEKKKRNFPFRRAFHSLVRSRMRAEMGDANRWTSVAEIRAAKEKDRRMTAEEKGGKGF
ncbi:unnamed protein product [Sphagnum troendelagicum]|uniref:Uncharacterized protein n=1 Tax=Sphagnum troendelagicum TaxID=128251 RepID=A0ABP0T7E0_9BRYO